MNSRRNFLQYPFGDDSSPPPSVCFAPGSPAPSLALSFPQCTLASLVIRWNHGVRVMLMC